MQEQLKERLSGQVSLRSSPQRPVNSHSLTRLFFFSLPILIVETISGLPHNLSRIVVVSAGKRAVPAEQVARIRDVEHCETERPVLAPALADGEVRCGVWGQVLRAVKIEKSRLSIGSIPKRRLSVRRLTDNSRRPTPANPPQPAALPIAQRKVPP